VSDAEHVLELLRAAVRDVVDSIALDDEVGVLLSGGIDSSTVACLLWELLPDAPAFTGFYQGEAYDERPWARVVADGHEHYEIEIVPADFVLHADECLRALEPPYEGPGAFGQWMVARYVSAQVDVVLSGEGGDELFGGYARLYPLAGLPMPEGYEDYVAPEGYPSNLEEALAWEWEHLPALLRVDEQTTRAHGLVSRAPMAESEELARHVLRLPALERVGKDALREAMRGIVPDEVLARRDKRGFPVPYVEWAQKSPVRAFVQERIGYVPDATRPWDRRWWLDMCEAVNGT